MLAAADVAVLARWSRGHTVLVSAMVARLHRGEPTVAVVVHHVLSLMGARGATTETAGQIAEQLGRSQRSVESALHRAYAAGTLRWRAFSGGREIGHGPVLEEALAAAPPPSRPTRARVGPTRARVEGTRDRVGPTRSRVTPKREREIEKDAAPPLPLAAALREVTAAKQRLRDEQGGSQ